MSLQALRKLRLEGAKPDLVKVLVGRRHAVLDGYADVIAVELADQPQRMDWRAVVGLPVMLFVSDGASDLGEQVFDAVKAAGCKVLGVAWSDVVIAPEAAHKTLNRMWRVLCQS